MDFLKENFLDPINTLWSKIIYVNERDVYFIGGTDLDKTVTGDCYHYNIKTNMMRKISSLWYPRAGPGVASVFNHIYAIGGTGEDLFEPVKNERYDIFTNEWTEFEPHLSY